MIHEQSSTAFAAIIHFGVILLVLGWLIAVVLGKVDLGAAFRDMDTFEIARSTPIFPEGHEDIGLVSVVDKPKPKKKQAKKPVHSLFHDCVLALRAIGHSNIDARRAASVFLKSNPDTDSVEKFLTEIFRKR